MERTYCLLADLSQAANYATTVDTSIRTLAARGDNVKKSYDMEADRNLLRLNSPDDNPSWLAV